MGIFKTIGNSFKKAWRGEEKLSVVFWGWGVLGQSLLYCFLMIYLGLFRVAIIEVTTKLSIALHIKKAYVGFFTIFLPSYFFALCVLIYLSISIWRCRRNQTGIVKFLYLVLAETYAFLVSVWIIFNVLWTFFYAA